MKTIYKEILFSTLLFMSAFLLTVFIHESGHAFFVKYFSLQGTMFHNRVDWNYETATKEQAIWVCLGGSIFSVIELLIFFPIALKLKSNNRFVQLFICWLAFWAIVQVLGYWIIGVIPIWNDISGVYLLTGTPWWIRIVAAIGALFLIRVLLGKLKNPISYAMNKNFSEDQTKQANAIILYPSFIATVILTLLQFPLKYILSISYPASIPLFILSTYFRVAKDKSLKFKENELKQNQLIIAALLFVILVIMTRIFAQGIKL